MTAGSLISQPLYETPNNSVFLLVFYWRNQRGYAKPIPLGAWHTAVTHKCSGVRRQIQKPAAECVGAVACNKVQSHNGRPKLWGPQYVHLLWAASVGAVLNWSQARKTNGGDFYF